MPKEIPKIEEVPKRETEYTENGLWRKISEKNEKGQLIYERKREFKNPFEPKEGEIKYDYEKRLTYDEESNLVKEEGKSFDHENGWRKEFEWEERKLAKETGEITGGPNQGHKWTKGFHYDENGNMVLEEGEILEQGKNPDKPPKGHSWRTKHLYENGKWIGEIGKSTNGSKEGKVWTKGKVSEEDIKNL